MIVEYEIAKLNIRIVTDFDMLQNGFSSLFATSFKKSDVDINITLGEIKEDGVIVYSDGFIDVFRSFDNNYRILYYITNGENKKYHFSVCNNNCILTSNCNDYSKDMYHFWGMIGLPHILIQHNRLMLHCSYIIKNGKAILFCGKSGVGKSTQANLWEKFENTKIINGDKAILFSENGKLYAASLPIAGSSNICSKEIAEVDTIILLAHCNENSVELLSASEKASFLAANVIFDVWRDGEIMNVIDLCSEFSQMSRIIKYKCLPDKSAVDYLKKVIE